MRTYPILLLALGLTLAACNDSGSPSTDGRLGVSTTTAGEDPDSDGYLLTIDYTDSLALDPTGTAEVVVASGTHKLNLLSVASHCSVAPATSLEVDVLPEDITPVVFEIVCPLTGARISTATTGLDIDLNGYHVAVDGTDQGVIAANATRLTRLEAGNRTIGLVDLTQNCTVDGPALRTVIIVDAEVAPVDFAVICTATSGVIGILVEASGTDVDGPYETMVDRGGPVAIGPGGSAYVTAVSAGAHLVSLVAPANCSVNNSPQSVSVTVSDVIRDTVSVSFSVTCRQGFGTLRITAPTTGPIPASDYAVGRCYDRSAYYCISYRAYTILGALAPNDTLIVGGVPPATFVRLLLTDIPAKCRVQGPNPTAEYTLTVGDTLDFEFRVAC